MDAVHYSSLIGNVTTSVNRFTGRDHCTDGSASMSKVFKTGRNGSSLTCSHTALSAAEFSDGRFKDLPAPLHLDLAQVQVTHSLAAVRFHRPGLLPCLVSHIPCGMQACSPT